jgi:hypothetical protein
MACASPQKNFEKGKFDKSYEGALKDLEKGSADRKVKTLLNKSFAKMLSQHTTDYELYMRSSEIQDWEEAYYKSEDLIDNYIRGKRWLNSDFDKPMADLEVEQDSLAYDLAKNYYDLANGAFDQFEIRGDKKIAQDAHQYFVKAAKFDPAIPEISDLISMSLDAATVHILVEADAWDFSHEWDINRQFKKIENESQGYRRVYFEDNLNNVDCHIEIDFNSLDVNISSNSNTENFSKEIIERYETVTDTSGVSVKKPVYKTVSGGVRIKTETKKYNWEARAKVDVFNNYCNFNNSRFNSDYVLEIKSYDVFGDERAIPDNYKNIKNEVFPKNDDNIIDKMISEIYEQFRRQYFR